MHDLQALSSSQLKQINLDYITESLQNFSLSQFKKSCFHCGIFNPSKDLVQTIQNLPYTDFPSDNDMKSSSFIVLCSSLCPLKLRFAEITPWRLITGESYFGS